MKLLGFLALIGAGIVCINQQYPGLPQNSMLVVVVLACALVGFLLLRKNR
jgi:uncharacterized membrane protein YccC